MRPRSSIAFSYALVLALALALPACTGGGGPPVVEIVARGLEFDAPGEIPSGWTTFRFRNESGMVHFALLERMPEGIGLVEQQEQVAPVFQDGMDLLNAGETEAALAKFGELPEWFGQIVFLGGPGLLSAGQTAETVVYLEPGNYLLECYVKTNGVFHSYNQDPETYGMVRELVVTAERSRVEEPEATLSVTISRERGIEVEGDPAPGKQTVAVRFEDQTVHGNFVGHDVHLVRLEDDTDLDALAAWMDWRRPEGLQTPAPALFLGGSNEMPAGATAYLNVQLEPGRYAWIAEVDEPRKKGMLKSFEVAADVARTN